MREGLGSLPPIVNLVTLHIKIKKQHTEKENNMEVMQTDVRVKDFPQFIETLIEQFKSERFRVGFIKKMEVKEWASLIYYIEFVGNNLMAQCMHVQVYQEQLTQVSIY